MFRLDHLNMSVQNLEKSVEFYKNLFGFELVEKGIAQSGERWGIIQSGESMLCLYEHSSWETIEDRVKDRHEISHFGLRVSPSEKIEEKLTELKIPVQYGGVIDYPYSKSWYIQDPTGHDIEIVEWDKNSAKF